MRLIFCLFALLFFEKNATAVVGSAADFSSQHIENQPVKLSERLVRFEKKGRAQPFFLEKKVLGFFKKNFKRPSGSQWNLGDVFAVISLLVGITLMVLIAAQWLAIYWALEYYGVLFFFIVTLPLSAIVCGVLAYIFKTERKWAAGLGIFFGVLTYGIVAWVAYILSGD